MAFRLAWQGIEVQLVCGPRSGILTAAVAAVGTVVSVLRYIALFLPVGTNQ